jgi:hypothetical protein
VQISSALARLISQGPGIAIGLLTEDFETLQVLIAWLNTGGNVGIHSKPVYLFSRVGCLMTLISIFRHSRPRQVQLPLSKWRIISRRRNKT